MFLNKLLSGAVALSLAAAVSYAAPGVRFNVADGNTEEAYNKLVNEKIQTIGYVLSDPHERINDGYAEKYGATNLDNLGFMSITNDEGLRPLLIADPRIGGFSPFNLHVYKLKNEDKTYVGHIVPETMLDIVGVQDKKTREGFIALFPSLDELVQKEIGGKVGISEYKALPEEPMMEFTFTFDRPDEIEDYVDEFQEGFEELFEEKKYIIAGYKNFRETYDDLELDFEKYDAYFVYSLCHFEFSNGIFNMDAKATHTARPDAGAFAPCSMYMYIEKDQNVMHVGMPKLENWIKVMDIKDPVKVKAIKGLDAQIIDMMKTLGGKVK